MPARRDGFRSTSFSSGLVGVLDPDEPVFGLHALLPASAASDRSTNDTLQSRRALAHVLQDAVAATVQVVHRHDVRAGVRAARAAVRGGGHAGCEGEAGVPPSRLGDARPAARRASGCGCARSRSPCARRGSTARRSRWRRSAASPRRCADRAPGPPWMTLACCRVSLMRGQLSVDSLAGGAAVQQIDARDQAQELLAVAPRSPPCRA